MKPSVKLSALLVICLFITCCKEDGEPTIPTPVMGIPCPGMPTVEYGGKTYNTVQIGNQCWLRENLDIGTMIQGIDTSSNNGVIEKYCYDNIPSYCDRYGGLYQWNEAMQYSTVEGTQGICPDGWHIPRYAEYETLRHTVSLDGNALKAIGQGDSLSPWNVGRGTNTSGFSAMLAGSQSIGGYFFDRTILAFFWSSTEGSPHSYSMDLFYISNYIGLGTTRGDGLSVRCLKD
jgi:uncharacterized protein (TIGR02145 family)